MLTKPVHARKDRSGMGTLSIELAVHSILLSAQRLSIVLVSPVLLWEEARWQWALQRCSRLVFEIFLGVQQPCRR